VVHGTGLEVGQSICGTGFVALSSLDAGYYGKGIYFTTNSLYVFFLSRAKTLAHTRIFFLYHFVEFHEFMMYLFCVVT
jgi:hypothetical protein